MSKRLLTCAVVLLVAASLSLAGGKGKEGSWTGWVTDDHCGAKGASEGHAACAAKCVKEMNAKYALYNPTDKKVYALNPQDKAADHAGHYVTVKGTVDGDTITADSIAMATPEKSEKPKS